jgi:hypothetical protein
MEKLMGDVSLPTNSRLEISHVEGIWPISTFHQSYFLDHICIVFIFLQYMYRDGILNGKRNKRRGPSCIFKALKLTGWRSL